VTVVCFVLVMMSKTLQLARSRPVTLVETPYTQKARSCTEGMPIRQKE